ncbi:hypothetical protein [Planctobacterium marinum]|uniref:Uncharacterized protein n=1 Tax=Planctobacterium marinum TaxID=1631968 RepID=A0AA48KRN2_9ALTE|nr:hypothetical protein MACH26_32790 [Planctobacterium marinum]
MTSIDQKYRYPLELITAHERADELEYFAFEFDGIHMWPIVRMGLLFQCYKAIEGIYFQAESQSNFKLQQERKYHLNALTLEQIERNIGNLASVDILIFSLELYRQKQGNRCVNLQEMLFADTPYTTRVVEDSYLDPSEYGFIWHEMVYQYGRLKANNTKISARDSKTIDDFMHYIAQHYSQWIDQDYMSAIRAKLVTMATRLPHWKAAYTQLIEQTAPKLAFIENAGYGTRAFQIKWLKQMGIRVAEIQHGQLNNHVSGYFFGPGVAEASWMQPYFPDDFLIWSEMWREKYSGGGNTYVLGNVAHQQALHNFNYQPEYILLCTNCFDVNKTITYAKQLMHQHPNYKIKVRIHPTMTRYSDEFSKALGEYFLKPENGESMAESLAKAAVVVSEPSTVLHESRAKGIPTFFLKVSSWDEIPELPLAEELLHMGKLPPRESNWRKLHDEYFSCNWQSNLNRYLEEAIGRDVR